MNLRKLIAAGILIVFIPVMAFAFTCLYEYAASRIAAEAFEKTSPQPTLEFLKGESKFPPGLGLILLAMAGSGVFDTVLIFTKWMPFGSKSNLYQPRTYPLGYALLRFRRYLLIPVAVAALVLLFYLGTPFPGEPDLTGHSSTEFGRHTIAVVVAAVAWLIARRPLNSSLWNAALDFYHGLQDTRGKQNT